ncbi:uncharacterized protein METZ01_LOCUS341935 [marine metagenome]|uniref:Uncharacterized protein n=1 Tax=marine metagenome TaxID=408172 RepID=A0A382QXM3_9ZZZZ
MVLLSDANDTEEIVGRTPFAPWPM